MTAHPFVMGYGRFDNQNTTSRNDQAGADWPALPRSVGGWPNGGGLHSPCDAQSTAAVSCHIFVYYQLACLVSRAVLSGLDHLGSTSELQRSMTLHRLTTAFHFDMRTVLCGEVALQ